MPSIGGGSGKPAQVRLPLVRLVPKPDGRVLFQVVGSALAPIGSADHLFLGEDGYTHDEALAVDIRGPQGAVTQDDTIIEGQPGATGSPGKSAYELWLMAGNEGLESDFLNSLKVKGESGLAGPKGDKGDKGDTGPQGPKGDAGSQGVQGVKGDTGAQGPKGDTGAQGVQGPVGPATATTLGTFTLSETATVAIAAGTRRLSVTVPSGWGVTTGQNLLVFPVSVPSAAYAIHDVIPTGTNTISVGVTTPLIALLSSYSISCRLVRINA